MNHQNLGFHLVLWLTLITLAATPREAAGNSPNDIPPILIMSDPANGATAVPTNSPVIFTFSKPMTPVHSITWSANVGTAAFDFVWGQNNQTLTCVSKTGLPANALITWMLDPATFKDPTGEPLLPFNNSGSFTTGSGSSPAPNPDSCTHTNVVGDAGGFSVSKYIGYVQNGPGVPTLDPEMGAVFSASVSSPTNNAVTDVTVQLPSGATRTLTSNPFAPRFFSLFEKFESQAALDAAFPNGAYRMTVRRQNGTSATATLNILANANPPVPQISNYPQTQGFNPAADFTLQWLAFAGATANDSIFLSLQDDTGKSFHAPDLCIPRQLRVTDTSIVIPQNTFAAGKVVEGNLVFSKNTSFDTNSIPGLSGFAGYSKSTSFKGQATGSSSVQPRFTAFSRSSAGIFQSTVTGQAGASFVIEGSMDLINWTPVTTLNASSGTAQFSDPASASLPHRFYRVKGP